LIGADCRYNAAMFNGKFSDDPVATAAEDKLDRAKFAGHVGAICRKVSQQGTSSVIALVGPWGSGKSSLLSMVREDVAADTQWVVTEFNPWLFSDLESLVHSFFGSLKAGLPISDKAKDAREKLGKYTEAVAPVGVLGTLLGVNAAPMLQKAGELIRGDVSADARRNQLENALKKLNQKVLVVVDDLDRLDPHDLLLVLKLIRLVGRLPNVYYLLAYDERTLIDVLRRSDLAWSDPRRARDYLEKIIQIRLDLPEVHHRDIEEMIDGGFSSLSTDHNIALTRTDQSRLGEAYSMIMQKYLSTPRAINKYFAQINATYPLVSGQVNFIDFALISFLRTFESSVYRMIWENRSDFVKLNRPSLYGKNAQVEDIKSQWLKKLHACGISDDDSQQVLEFLGWLFPAFGSSISGSGSFLDSGGLEARFAVGSEYHFDRYFQFGISKFDLTDATIVDAFNEIDAQQAGESVALLARLFQVSPMLAITKTSRLVRLHPLMRAGLLLDFLSDIYPTLDNTFTLTGISSQVSLRRLAFDVLGSISTDVGRRVALSDVASGEAVFLLLDILRMIKKSGDEVAWYAALESEVLDKVESRINSAHGKPLDAIDGRIIRLLRFWFQHKPDQCRAWVWSAINDGSWPLVALLRRLVHEGTIMSAEAPTTIAGFDEQFVIQILGLDAVVAALPDQPVLEEPLGEVENVWNPSEELKGAFALSYVRRLAMTSQEIPLSASRDA
jgi:hypothetical protein